MVEFKWIFGYIKKYWIRMLIAIILVLSMVGLNMINPYLTGKIVDDVIIGGKKDILVVLFGIMIGATLLKSAVRYIFQLIFEYVSQNVVYNIRDRIYSKIQGLDFQFFDNTKTGDVMSRMTGDLEAVRHFTSWVVYQIIVNSTTFIVVTVILLNLNYKLALSLLVITPVTCFFTVKLSRIVKPAFWAIREQFAKLNSVVQENISGNRVVKAFAKELFEKDKFSAENKAFKDRNMEAAAIWGKYLPILDASAGVLSVLIILVGGMLVINGSLTIGELVAFNGYLWALNGPMRMMGWLVNDTQRFAASADKILMLEKREPGVSNSRNSIAKERLSGSVEFKNVTFDYGDEAVLKNISFRADPGDTVAIVGPTGAGKSSLVNLIGRYYDCTAGEVLIDGLNIKDIDITSLRENVSSAMQDIFLFSDTIEGNIAYGEPDAPLENVIWAARTAGAHEFIEEFHDGYDTIIGERGVGLSGGQKQRIALARALIKNPSILILDDTTSSVDIETEHDIQSSLKAIYGDRTTFIIAHRISSVKNADLILVLIDGEIVERGTHKELLGRKGYYYSVFINQYGDFDQKQQQSVS